MTAKSKDAEGADLGIRALAPLTGGTRHARIEQRRPCAIGLAVLSLVGIIAVPLALNLLGLSQQLGRSVRAFFALAIALPCGLFRARLP